MGEWALRWARVSFSLKVESLRDEHPEVRKRLGSFESARTWECIYSNHSITAPEPWFWGPGFWGRYRLVPREWERPTLWLLFL